MNTNLSIIIPTINRKDLLLEALTALDKQWNNFDKLLIIDNGNQDILSDIQNFEMVKFHKIDIYIPGKNLGVGASWNYGINYFINSSHLLIVNDDVVLGESQVEKIRNFNKKNNYWLAVGNNLWSVFGISQVLWKYFLDQDGFVFDENFFPAYFEDNDMHYRLKLANGITLGTDLMNPKIFRNSMTIKKDPSINSGFDKNRKFYVQKWGGTPGQEIYKKPFDKK